MSVVLQFLIVVALASFMINGGNIPQDSDLNEDWPDQIVFPDSDINDDEFSDDSATIKLDMADRDNFEEMVEESVDEYQRQSIAFPDVGIDNEFFEDPESMDYEVIENDTAARVQKKFKKGYCHFKHNVWYKPNQIARCGKCLKCVCWQKGTWNCQYSWRYCPYYYCNNVHYHPTSQVCCCGKLHAKKPSFMCCGFQYYNANTNKCCKRSFTVSLKNDSCPR